MLFDGQGALPAVCYQLADQSAPFTLYDLPDRLRARGWQVPAYPLPANRQDTTVQQILIRHGFSREMARLMVRDIERGVATLGQAPARPSPPSITPSPAGRQGETTRWFSTDAMPTEAAAAASAAVPSFSECTCP